MTIFARDADTGMAKWVYQMTPHDEWDYDGVNEMILADMDIGGQDAQGPRPLRPQRLRLHARPRHGRAARRREVRSGGELGHQGRHGQEQRDLRPSAGRREVLDRSRTAKTSTRRTSARRRSAPRTSSRPRSRPKTGLFYVPTNHVCMDYEPFQVSYTRGPALRRRDALHVSGAERRRRHGQLHRLGRPHGQDRLVASRSSSRCGPARSRPPATSCSTARSKAI